MSKIVDELVDRIFPEPTNEAEVFRQIPVYEYRLKLRQALTELEEKK